MKELDKAQLEQLKTIGEYLYQERQRRSISLDEIAVKTYIPLRLLQALEVGQIERLPEPVFVQGFIRRYADAIGLDGLALASTFTPQPAYAMEPSAPEVNRTPVETAVPAPVEFAPMAFEPERRGRSSFPYIVMGAAVVLLLGAGVLAMFKRPQPSSGPSAPEANNPPATAPARPEAPEMQAQAVSPVPSPSTTASPSATAPNADAPVQVTVNLTDASWMEVKVDGQTKFEGTLKKGDQKTWTAQKQLELTSGNAGAVSVSYNQGAAKLMGALGDVKAMTFSSSQPKPTASPN